MVTQKRPQFTRAHRFCRRSRYAKQTQAAEQIKVVVDDRERPSGVVGELEKLGESQSKLSILLFGDYCIDGAVLIERKTAADDFLFYQDILFRAEETPMEDGDSR